MNIISEIEKHFKKEKELLIKAIEDAKITRDSSTSAMQSWSDTSRNQAENLVIALEEKLKKLEMQIASIPEQKGVKIKDKVSLWNLVEVESEAQKSKIVLVPKGAGGKNIKDIKLVSEDSPLGKELLGKKVGQKFIFNDKNIRVIKLG